MGETAEILEKAKQTRYLNLLQKVKSGKLTAGELKELELHEKGPQDAVDYRAMSQAQASFILNTSAPTINKWVSNGCPVAMKGGKKVYDCGKIFKWRIEYERELLGIDGDLVGGSSSDPHLQEYRKVKTDAARFDLEIKKGQFILKEDHELQIKTAGEYIRDGFMDIPKRISTKVAKEKDVLKISKIIKNEIMRVLKGLSNGALGRNG